MITKKIYQLTFLLVAFLMMSLSLDAAEPTPSKQNAIAGNAGPEDIQAAYNYLPMVKTLGVEEIAYAQLNKERTQMLIEYLPKGETVENWSRMVTIVLTPVETKTDADYSTTIEIIKHMQAQIQKHDPKGTFEVFGGGRKRDTGKPERYAAFFNYHIGAGAQREHNVGLVFKQQPEFAINLQLQKRGGDLSAEEVEAVKNLIAVKER